MPDTQTTHLQTWDTAIVGLIEETPEMTPEQLTQFNRNVHMYVNRPAPSWETAQKSA